MNDELDFDLQISKHNLVPKHEIVKEKETKEIIQKYNATPNQIPFILSTDPVIREIQAKPGDLIKITRKSPTAGTFMYYRIVVEG